VVGWVEFAGELCKRYRVGNPVRAGNILASDTFSFLILLGGRVEPICPPEKK